MDCHFRDLPDFQSFEARWQINGKSQKWMILNDFIVRNENSKILFAQLIVGPAATEQRQIDVALSLSNVERQTG